MRRFRFYLAPGGDAVSIDAIKMIADRINADEEMLAEAEKVNRNYADQIRELLTDDENDVRIGGMIRRIGREIPRYSYIKNVRDGGFKYDVRIDLLDRSFMFHEIEED